jgi:membrane protease YdiL (CAAX protease family)
MTKSTRSQLINFFLITFGWSWLINLPRVLANFKIITLPPMLSTIMGYIAVFGPMIAAFLLTSIHSKKAGVKVLWKSGWNTKFPKVWLLPTLFLMPLMGLLTFIILRAFNQPIDWSYGLPPAMIVPIGLLIWLLGSLPEEYGWRGYALPRLQRAFNPLVAGLFLGIIWGIWHLPLHFIEGTTQYVIPVWEYVVQTIVLSIIYSWLFNGTGSVFVAILFHTIANLTGAIFPYWTTSIGRWISFILLLAAAIIIVVVKGTHFHKNKVTQLEL